MAGQNQPLWVGTRCWIMVSECRSKLGLEKKKRSNRSYRKCISALCVPGLGNCACLVQIPPSSHGNSAEEANITYPPVSSHCPLPKRCSKMLSLTSAMAAPCHHLWEGLFSLCKKTMGMGEMAESWWRKSYWNAPYDGCCSLGIAHGAGPRGCVSQKRQQCHAWCPPGKSGSSRMRQKFLQGEMWDHPQPYLPPAETFPVNTTRVQGFPW